MSKYSHFEMCEKIFGQKYKWNEQKHDYEPYSRTDMWNKMIEQQDKIADLEAKFAESEKEHELLKEQLQEQIDYKDEYYHYWQETKKELAKENEILNVALDLACQTLYDINFKLYNTEMDFKEYFKQQATNPPTRR